MEIIKGGITVPQGFEAAACEAGIKYQDRLDMALIYSKKPCRAAGVFTQNVVKAAPVLWDMEIINSRKKPQAVVINAGTANACTGAAGLRCCQETALLAAETMKMDADSVLVASTGVIGMEMPIDKMQTGIRMMAVSKNDSFDTGTEAARAIMTTDTREKEIAVQVEIDGKIVTVGGMAKGSGMIHPNMCTMLAFLTSDVLISKKMLQHILETDVEETYNMISVDGDTSTNDTVLFLANGMAGNKKLKAGTEDYTAFIAAVRTVNEYLAKAIAADGEGATALFEVTVKGSKTKEKAKTLAKSVVTSSLTKAAIAGHDANWGRFMCALGYSGEVFEPSRVDLFIESAAGKLQLVGNGMAVDYSEEKATEILKEAEVTLLADMKEGVEWATAWGCDLTHGYIDINADYRS